jgi:hypothetical protein
VFECPHFSKRAEGTLSGQVFPAARLGTADPEQTDYDGVFVSVLIGSHAILAAKIGRNRGDASLTENAANFRHDVADLDVGPHCSVFAHHRLPVRPRDVNGESMAAS